MTPDLQERTEKLKRLRTAVGFVKWSMTKDSCCACAEVGKSEFDIYPLTGGQHGLLADKDQAMLIVALEVAKEALELLETSGHMPTHLMAKTAIALAWLAWKEKA